MNGTKKRVLLVDDEPIFTRLLKRNLEKTGTYEVRETNVGSQALAAAQDFQPDVILLDLIMPDVDGRTVASWIRSAEGLKETQIIFLTAVLTKAEAKQKCGQLSSIPCLAKPVSAQEVIGFIERCAQ